MFATFETIDQMAAGSRLRAPEQTAELPHSFEIQALPAWGALEKPAAESIHSAYMAAGIGLALFDGIVRRELPFIGALRQRLALQAATASAKILRLREDHDALRDAIHLGLNDAPGPAGRIHRLWRNLATLDAVRPVDQLEAAPALIGLGVSAASGLCAQFENAAITSSDPVTAAAAAATIAYAHSPNPEGEILAAWVADLVLARRLGWRKPAPLLMAALILPALRRDLGERRPRPNDPDWPHAVARAYALASRNAFGIAADLARRSEKLLAVAPKLRARRAEQVIQSLLADDCVGPTRVARRAGLSERASRRLFERLMELQAIRELSGRPTFRLYGL